MPRNNAKNSMLLTVNQNSNNGGGRLQSCSGTNAHRNQLLSNRFYTRDKLCYIGSVQATETQSEEEEK